MICFCVFGIDIGIGITIDIGRFEVTLGFVACRRWNLGF